MPRISGVFLFWPGHFLGLRFQGGFNRDLGRNCRDHFVLQQTFFWGGHL